MHLVTASATYGTHWLAEEAAAMTRTFEKMRGVENEDPADQ
jgi:hypothetical protein